MALFGIHISLPHIDLGKVLKAVPGMIINVAVAEVHGVAQLGGLAVQATGSVLHNKKLNKFGKDIKTTDTDIAKALNDHPLEAGTIIAGTALVVAGVVTGGSSSVAGAGLLLKGISGIGLHAAFDGKLKQEEKKATAQAVLAQHQKADADAAAARAARAPPLPPEPEPESLWDEFKAWWHKEFPR